MLARIISWLEHSIRCVVITPFGLPVEPEVNKIFTTVSGVTRACAASTAVVVATLSRAANDSESTTSTPSCVIASAQTQNTPGQPRTPTPDESSPTGSATYR